MCACRRGSPAWARSSLLAARRVGPAVAARTGGGGDRRSRSGVRGRRRGRDRRDGVRHRDGSPRRPHRRTGKRVRRRGEAAALRLRRHRRAGRAERVARHRRRFGGSRRRGGRDGRAGRARSRGVRRRLGRRRRAADRIASALADGDRGSAAHGDHRRGDRSPRRAVDGGQSLPRRRHSPTRTRPSTCSSLSTTPASLVPQLRNAGTVFVGERSSVSFGDYMSARTTCCQRADSPDRTRAVDTGLLPVDDDSDNSARAPHARWPVTSRCSPTPKGCRHTRAAARIAGAESAS